MPVPSSTPIAPHHRHSHLFGDQPPFAIRTHDTPMELALRQTQQALPVTDRADHFVKKTLQLLLIPATNQTKVGNIEGDYTGRV